MSMFRPTNNSMHRYARVIACVGFALVCVLGLFELGEESPVSSNRRRLKNKVQDYADAGEDVFSAVWRCKKHKKKAMNFLKGVLMTPLLYTTAFAGTYSVIKEFTDMPMYKFTFRIHKDKRVLVKLEKIIKTGTNGMLPMSIFDALYKVGKIMCSSRKAKARAEQVATYGKYCLGKPQYAELKSFSEIIAHTGQDANANNRCKFILSSLKKSPVCNRWIYFNAPLGSSEDHKKANECKYQKNTFEKFLKVLAEREEPVKTNFDQTSAKYGFTQVQSVKLFDDGYLGVPKDERKAWKPTRTPVRTRSTKRLRTSKRLRAHAEQYGARLDNKYAASA